MHSPSRGGLRLARACAWAIAAMGLSTGAHVVGGGALPSPGAAALITAVLLWSGLILTQWRLGRVALTISLSISQLLLHSALMAAESSVGDCVTTGSHHAMVACAGGTTMSHGTSPTMLLAHAAAALLLALLLSRGEDAVWFLAGLLVPRLPSAPALPVVPHLALTPSPVHEPVRSATVPGGVGRRGPPARRAPAIA